MLTNKDGFCALANILVVRHNGNIEGIVVKVRCHVWADDVGATDESALHKPLEGPSRYNLLGAIMHRAHYSFENAFRDKDAIESDANECCSDDP